MRSVVALCAPNSLGSYRSSNIVAENLALGSLGSWLQAAGYDVVICDARFHDLRPEEAVQRISERTTCLVGLSMIAGSRQSVEWVDSFVRILRAKRPGVHVTLGGYFPTLQPERTLGLFSGADSVVLGEGELTLAELVKYIDSDLDWRSLPGIAYRIEPQADIVVNPKREPIVDLDSLPLALRSAAFQMSDEFEVLIEGSRGCIASCTFCAIKPFLRCVGAFGRRCRSPVSIVDEMARLRAANPRLRRFRFVDPDFLGLDENQRVCELAGRMRSQLPGIQVFIEARSSAVLKNEAALVELKLAGLAEVYLGIESGSQAILDRLNKGATVEENLAAVETLRRLGIGFTYGFMMFTPWTTETDIHSNLTFLARVGKIQMDKLFNDLDLIPGTPIAAVARRDRLATSDTSDGYWGYQVQSEPVESLRRVGCALERDNAAFMERLWYIYKDTQAALQSGVADAVALENDADRLFLEIFDFCYERTRAFTTQAPQSIADACIRQFGARVDDLERSAERAGRFPRRTDVRHIPPVLGVDTLP
jgi:anaerobic magnesium-protoporphyrin IX monomethyl ester cyclase